MISALRGSGAVIAPSSATLSNLRSLLNLMGHVPFGWDTPDGYPDRIEYWAGNILPRWNAMTSISNASTGQYAVADANFTKFGSTAVAIVGRIDEMVFGGEMSQRTRDELTTYLSGGTINVTRIRETLSLAMSSSAFQWY
jgi:hypothetical protein